MASISLTATGARERTGARALLVASAATFLAYLDVTVVNVAFPALEQDFPSASLTALSWTVTAYAVSFAALLAPLGRIADLKGRRTIFIAGIGLFAAASALAAAAPSATALIVARAIQGAGAAAMIPSALGIVLATAPPERRVAAVGIWGAAGSLAAAAGPAIGGVLVDALDWRAVLLANLPIAALAIIGARTWLPDLRPQAAERPDALGATLFTGALATLVVGLTQTGPWGWGDARTVGLLAVAAVLLAAATVRAARHVAPAVDVRLFAHRRFTLAAVGSAFAGASLFAWLLFGVLFLNGVWGYSILEAGLGASPGALFSVAASIVAGRAAQRGRAGVVIAGGGVLMLLTGLLFAANIGPHPAYLTVWLPAGVGSGVGFGLLMTGVAAAAAAALPPQHFAAGTGLNLTARQVGGAVGVAIAASLVSTATDPIDGFQHVFALCGLFGLPAALAGVLLTTTKESR